MSTYIVEFDNGKVDALTANRIAQSMYEMCDEEGRQILVFDTVVDWRRHEDALKLSEQSFKDKAGKNQIKRTTAGWDLCIQWKDGSTSWEKLSDMKQCYPVETAEYAVAQGIDSQPAFNWWVKHVLKK